MLKSKPNISFRGSYKFPAKLIGKQLRFGGEMVEKAREIRDILHTKGIPAEILYHYTGSDTFATLKTGNSVNPKLWHLDFWREPKPLKVSPDITAEKILEMDAQRKRKGIFSRFFKT